MTKNQNKRPMKRSPAANPWTKKYKFPSKKLSSKQTWLAILALSIIVPIGLVSNVLPFVYNTVRCGRLPVESSKFMASYSYRIPGDKGYGINLFSDYNFCTQSEIMATNGYHRDVSTDEAKKENAERRAKRADEQKFSLSKVDYTVYTPQGYTIDDLKVDDIKGNIHTFYKVQREGGLPYSVRLLKSEDAYNICSYIDNPKERYCKVIGQDSQGNEIKREFLYRRGTWISYYAGTNINGTGIVIGADNDQEALAILGSMREYSE